MMGEHLCIVLSPLLNVDNQYLLHPECELYKIIPFEQPGQLSVWPSSPELSHVQPVIRMVHQKLFLLVSLHILSRVLLFEPMNLTIPREKKTVE